MAENRLTEHQTPQEKFEREMTTVLLELREEFSPERVGTRMAEHSAELPPPPKVPSVQGSLPPWQELDRVPLHQTQLPEKPPEPLPALSGDALPRVTVTGRGRKLSPPPLAAPSKRTVDIPGAVRNPEPPALQAAKNRKVALPARRERPSDAGPSIQEQAERQHPKFPVVLCSAKLPEERKPLKLVPFFAVAVPDVPAAKPVPPLALPTRRKVAMFQTRPWKEGAPLDVRCSNKVPLPGEVRQHGYKPLDVKKPGKTAIAVIKLPKEANSLELDAPSHVAIPGRAVMPYIAKPVLPAERKVAMFHTEPWKEGKPLDVRYLGEVSLPGKVRRHSCKPLDVKKPGKAVITAIKPPKGTNPLELEAPSNVAIPSRAVMPYIAKPVLSAKREVVMSKRRPWKKGAPLDVRYIGKVPLPGEVEEYRPEPLNVGNPGKAAVSAVKPPEETRPLELAALTANVTIPGRMAAHAVASPALPGKRRVEVRSPSLPAEEKNVRTMPPLNVRVPVAETFPEKRQLEPPLAIVRRRVDMPYPINIESPQKLRVEMPKNTREWFDLTPWDFLVEEIVFSPRKPENSITLESAPNLLEIWEKMDGPVALIADYGRIS